MMKWLTRPTGLMLMAGAAAAVGNAIAFAASSDVGGSIGSGSRLGVSLREAAAQRDSMTAAQKRRLDMREQALKASEARLAGQVRQQQEAQAAAAKTAAGSGAPAVPYDNLARIYQTMKPARAGPIFEKLDIEVQREVASRMRERATAQIMAAMSPQGAVALSMALAGRKVVPAPARVAAKP